MFRNVPECSGMFRNVPECSGMFHVPGFIDAPFWRPFYFKSFKNAKICRYTLTDWTYHDWLTDWSDVSFFSHVKKHRSRFWLARTNLRTKIYDMAFSWVFLSMYIINTIPHGKCFVRYLRTRCFCIRNLTRSLRSLLRFLIRQHLVRKYRTPALSMKYSLFPMPISCQFHSLCSSPV